MAVAVVAPHSRSCDALKQRRHIFGPDVLEVVDERSAEELRPVLDATRAPRLVQIVDGGGLHAHGQHLESHAIAVGALRGPRTMRPFLASRIFQIM